MKLVSVPKKQKKANPFGAQSNHQLRMFFDSLVVEGKTRKAISKEISYRQSLSEKDDMSALPDAQLKEIQKNIKDGAKDTTQLWANALELVHKAYEVAKIERPDITMEAAWKQYEEMIEFAVRELAKTRGPDGDWRMSSLSEGQIEKPDGEIDEYSIESDINGLPVRVTRKADTIDQVIKPFYDHNVTDCDIEMKQRSKEHVILYWCDDEGKRTGDKVVIKKVKK